MNRLKNDYEKIIESKDDEILKLQNEILKFKEMMNSFKPTNSEKENSLNSEQNSTIIAEKDKENI